MNSSEKITNLLGNHYGRKFAEHGTTPEGVDWGPNPADQLLRLDRMLAVLELGDLDTKPSLLDVGCGYGSLLDLIQERTIPLSYAGIDVCAPMISAAKARHPMFEYTIYLYREDAPGLVHGAHRNRCE